MRFDGIHHITAITGDAPRNVDFYTRVLGLRLTAKSVNQDDPSVYHLFYGDEVGSPGADLTLLVKDNGKGAPPSAFERSNAFGVMGMRERAGHHGGWLQIDSEPGQGTQVILSMPLACAPVQERAA